MEEKIHVFEKAGLGKAPFQYVGMYIDRGPHKTIVNGVTMEIGSPGQPMGICDFCGNGIAECYQIKSHDGKIFVVGSSCVAKTGDRGLKAQVNKEKTKLAHEKDDKKIADNLIWVNENREILSSIYRGKYSLLSSIEWYYKNAGRSGKLRIIREAKKAVEERKNQNE